MANTYPWPQDGNVGIGTTSPDAPLDVEVATNSLAILATRADVNPMRLKMGFNGSSGNPYLQGDRDGSGVQPLLLNPDGGNVGIGAVSPDAKLEVAGELRITSADPLITFNTTVPLFRGVLASTLTPR